MKRLRILVADDEAIIRLGLKTILKELGHEIILAEDGREALRLALQTRPDLALLDIKMPFTDGLEVARALARKQPLPIVLLTAFTQRDLIEQAARLPIHAYLVKPVKEAELAAAIEVAVARFEDARQLAAHAAELQEDLETRKIIERAKGKLMQRGLTEEAAYRKLQEAAREARRTLRQVAQAILREPE